MASRRKAVRWRLRVRRLLMGRFTSGRDINFQLELPEMCCLLFPRSRLSRAWSHYEARVTLAKTRTLEKRKGAAPALFRHSLRFLNLKQLAELNLSIVFWYSTPWRVQKC